MLLMEYLKKFKGYPIWPKDSSTRPRVGRYSLSLFPFKVKILGDNTTEEGKHDMGGSNGGS